jgi:tRNA dimethylallyltransferase
VLDEVARVMALGLEPSLPGMKAVGAPELMAHLKGELPCAEALARARTATRNYAKRQLTWMRNQMPGWRRLTSGDPATDLAGATEWIEKAG